MPAKLESSPEVLAAIGDLDVPPGTPTRDFAYMEEQFRSVLWPRPLPGHQRSHRVLYYCDNNTKLHYEIYDIPIGVRK